MRLVRLDSIREEMELALALDDLASAESYTYSHSVPVATLGLLLGQRINRMDGWIDWRGQRRYDRSSERMTELAMGLLIHDIGKISIPGVGASPTMNAASVQVSPVILGQRANAALCDGRHHGRRRRFLRSMT